MRLNTKSNIPQKQTHEGATAKHINPEQQLRRSVMACLLWEDTFYESGASIVDRIAGEAKACSKEFVSALAIEARTVHGLRHAPLILLLELIRRGGKDVAKTIHDAIGRVDEIPELLAIYWREGKKPLSAQMKRGLSMAFSKFDEYQLAKYNRDGPIKLRDALFLCHAKPDTPEREDLYKRLIAGELKTPDTWEVKLSSGADKKETFERLLREDKLGYMALLRNLRNMADAGVDENLVRSAITERKGASLVLPFRYIAAARACPMFEPQLDAALCASVEEADKLSGKTIVLVDVSGSMATRLSAKSDMDRMDAACALAAVLPGDRRVFSFSYDIVEVPPRNGMACVDAIKSSQSHGGTNLGRAVEKVNRMPHDRLIVITDEQSHDIVPDPVCKRAYMINVASYQNGVGYGAWTHIDGFSERIIRYIMEIEKANLD